MNLRMNLRKKVLCALAVILLLAWSLAYFILNLSLESIYSEIEERQIANTKLSIEQIIANKKSDLVAKVKDWAIWDDAYAFIAGDNKNFIRVNINQDVLENFQINSIVFTDKKHKPIYFTSIDGKEKEIEQALIENVDLQRTISQKKLDEPFVSVVRLRNDYYLLAISKVTPTENPQSLYNGYLYFYQKIDEKFLSNISMATGVSLSLSSKPLEGQKEIKDESSIFLYYPLTNHTDTVVVSLEGKAEREYAQLFKTLRKAVVATSLVFTVLFFLLIYFSLNKIILFPLKKIEEQTNALASGNHSLDRIEYSGNDEFSSLGKSINRMLDERDKMQRNLQHKSQLMSLGELASGIAHEINNPLTIILLSAEKLKRRYSQKLNEEPEMEKLIDKINTTGNRISKIVSGMRSLSKNVDPHERNVVSIPKLVEETIELFRERAKDNDVEFKLTIKDDEEIFALVNATQISQVIVNLLSNALDAVESRIDRKIIVQVLKEGSFFKIRVADNGYGISEDLKGKIMQPFFTTKNSQRGTGLGLSICHEIVEQHGGKITFFREIIQGEQFTVFCVELKLQKDLFETAPRHDNGSGAGTIKK